MTGWKKAGLFVLLFLSFLALFPLSVLISNPLFTHPFNPDWPYGVLLVWPDRIEIRFVHSIGEVSPRPANAAYTFNVAPERQAWVEQQVRGLPQEANGAAYGIQITQLGQNKQRIKLESWRDGFTGLIYEATPDKVVPLRTRHAGPGSSLIILYINFLLWGIPWLLVLVINRLRIRHRNASSL